MWEALRLHTATHLRFLARSRLLLGLAVVFGTLWSLGLVGFLLMDSSGDRFDMLKMISGQLRSFGWFYTAAMGLFAFWWHTSHRTTTLVFTRPGRPEIWLAPVFSSAFVAAFVIHVLGLLLTVGLSLAWRIPLQTGFLWLTVDAMLESLIMVSVLTGLAAALHPIVAVLVVVFFTESMFYMFDTMLLGYLQATGSAPWLRILEYAVRGIHGLLPMLDPFAAQTAEVERSLRVGSSDWVYLAATAGYAATVFIFWFLFADYRLRGRILN